MSKPWSATPWRTKLSRFIREAVAMIRAQRREHNATSIRRVHQMLAGAGR